MYTIILSKSVSRFFEGADATLQKKLDRCFEALTVEPRRHNNIKPLKGRFTGYLRFRVGDHRVVYRIDAAQKHVIVVDVAHRKDIYE